jgi:iron transport multicopper oxidase
MSCDPYFTFSIAGHTMTIIEADGVPTAPLVVDELQIFAGQRYSFVLDTNGKKVDNYWVTAIPNRGPNTAVGGVNSAVLRYRGAPEAEPTTPPPSAGTNPLVEANLRPLPVGDTRPYPPPPINSNEADIQLNLELGFDPVSGKFTVNGVPFESPSVPVLLQILSGNRNASELLPKGSVYPLPLGKTVVVSIPGGSVGSPVRFFLGP